MIDFDPDQLTVRYAKLKSITTALGGSISVVDEEKTAAKGREVFTKISVPLAVARQFIKVYQVRNYLKPFPIAIAYYGDTVVALERYPYVGENDVDTTNWTPNIVKNISGTLIPETRRGTWYTDGAFVYRTDVVRDQSRLDSDNRFTNVQVAAIKLSDLCIPGGMHFETRSCIRYNASNGERVLSAPIWKNLDRVGVRQLNKSDQESDDDEDTGIATVQQSQDQFDRIDQYLAVNLNFALRAGTTIADHFGYKSIEPLRLDRLMVQLDTVNLPNLSKEVKRTYDIGMTFTHAIAWLLGFLRKAETIEQYDAIRSLLKYLTTKGVYRKNAFTNANVYMSEDYDLNSVPLFNRKQAEERVQTQVSQMTFEEWVQRRGFLHSQNDESSAVAITGLDANDA